MNGACIMQAINLDDVGCDAGAPGSDCQGQSEQRESQLIRVRPAANSLPAHERKSRNPTQTGVLAGRDVISYEVILRREHSGGVPTQASIQVFAHGEARTRPGRRPGMRADFAP